METPEIPSPPTGVPPLIFGPGEITEGYYRLEELERGFSLETMSKNQIAVSLWYQALTLYRRGMLGPWNYPGDKEMEDNLTAWNLQSQLLGLGVGSAKSALDLLLAGYYSNAFAIIRHILESVIQSIYLETFTLESPLWFGKPGRFARDLVKANPSKKPPKNIPPNCKEMVERLKKEYSARPIWGTRLDSMYDSWVLMSKGSHPTAEGMRQTNTNGNTSYRFDPTYFEDLCLVGFDHGLAAVNRQLISLSSVKPQPQEWTDRRAALSKAIDDWRQTLEDKQEITDLVAPEEEDV